MTNTITEQTNATIVRNFMEAFWNKREKESVKQFLTEDYLDHAYEQQNVNGLQLMAVELGSAFPDHQHTIDDIVVEGSKVMARMTLRGTHKGSFRGTAATGQSIDVTVYRTFRMDEEKIAEHWALVDTAKLLRTLSAPLTTDNGCKINK
jgi:steroid delta-isomerase-like uncharacterized protein